MPQSRTDTEKGRRRQNYTTDRGALLPGEVVSGYIVDHNYATMTYTVQLRGQAVAGVQDMTGVFTGLLGFRTANRLAPGTQVAVLVGKPGWIIGTSAYDLPDQNSGHSRVMTGRGLKDAIGQIGERAETEAPHHSAPDDLYQGEFEIANLTGTFIRFLTFMSSIGGSERAKVECHVLRDLVRVVSRNFEHFSSSGDFKILDDGRLSMEMNGTSYDHERWGLLNANSPKFTANGTDMPEDLDPKETGRWRYTMLLGFLGDLFNTWFTDPAETAGKMAEEALRSGKARFHVGQDGAILVQSCSEIALERVCRIPVPIRLKHEEDPEGVLRKEMNSLDKAFLRMWKTEASDEHHQLFKVREYVRFLNQYHSLARIHQMAAKKQEWEVPSESDTPAPTAGAGEKDRTEANSESTYWKDCYSTIRIYKDGSTLIMDAYGNATATGAYGIQHSSTRHIHLYAAGDIVQKAGGSVYISGKRHAEVVAHRGSLVLKGRTALRALCEAGTLWLKSDYDPDNPYTPASGDPEPEAVGRQGIRIQATLGESRWLSKLKTKVVLEKRGENLEIETKGKAKLTTDQEIEILGKEGMIIQLTGTVKVRAREWLNKLAKGWKLDGVCSLTKVMCQFTRVEAGALLARFRLAGPEQGPQVKEGKCCFRDHSNHVQIYDNNASLTEDLKVEDEISLQTPEPDPSGASWKMVPKEEYEWNNPGLAEGKSDFDFEPIAQQTIRLEGSSAYEDWGKMTDKLRSAPETAPDTPWPGESFKWLTHNPSKPTLNEPASDEASSFSASIQTALTPQTPNFKILKR